MNATVNSEFSLGHCHCYSVSAAGIFIYCSLKAGMIRIFDDVLSHFLENKELSELAQFVVYVPPFRHLVCNMSTASALKQSNLDLFTVINNH